MSLKLIEILKEDSIFNINKNNLIKKFKFSLLELFPNLDLNLFLESFYDDYPDSETLRYFNDDIDVFEIDKKQFSNIINSSEMNKYLMDVLDRPIIKEILSKIKKDGSITIYRSLTVNKDWFNKLKIGEVKRLGIYWSWLGGYPAYGENKEYVVELTAEINEKYINWTQSIIQNIMYEDIENEITLFKNTPLKLTKIKYKKKTLEYDVDINTPYMEVNPEYFNNSTFYA